MIFQYLPAQAGLEGSKPEPLYRIARNNEID